MWRPLGLPEARRITNRRLLQLLWIKLAKRDRVGDQFDLPLRRQLDLVHHEVHLLFVNILNQWMLHGFL